MQAVGLISNLRLLKFILLKFKRKPFFHLSKVNILVVLENWLFGNLSIGNLPLEVKSEWRNFLKKTLPAIAYPKFVKERVNWRIESKKLISKS